MRLLKSLLKEGDLIWYRISKITYSLYSEQLDLQLSVVLLKGETYMPKPALLLAGAGAIVIIGGAVVLMTLEDEPKTNNVDSSIQVQDTKTSSKIDDPNGDYAYFSDPSVTKFPEKNVRFGNGQVLNFEYDGSKTNNDEYATLSYQLYYIQDDGKVIPIGGGNLEGKGKGSFSTASEDKVFNSSAKDKSGFFELQGTYTTGTTGTNVKLGMYPINFDIAE